MPFIMFDFKVNYLGLDAHTVSYSFFETQYLSNHSLNTFTNLTHTHTILLHFFFLKLQIHDSSFFA